MENILFRWIQVQGAGERIIFLSKRASSKGPYGGWMIDIGHNNDRVFYSGNLINLVDDEDIFDSQNNIEPVDPIKWDEGGEYAEGRFDLQQDMIRALFL